MRAHKGNVTVVMNQDEYKQKVLNMSGDSSTIINKDPTRKLIESVMILLRWKNLSFIMSLIM